MINACNLSSVKSITLICPLLFYSRGDKRVCRTSISSKAVADLLQINRLVTIDLHSPIQQGFYSIPVDNLYSISVISEHLNNTIFKSQNKSDLIAVSPDAGSIARTIAISRRLNLPVIYAHKERDYSKLSTILNLKIITSFPIKNKIALIFDDIADSFNTNLSCIKALEKEGVKKVYVIITHGVFSENAINRINNCKILEKVIVTNSINQTEKLKLSKKIELVNISNLFAKCIKCLITGNSISDQCF